MSIPLYRLIDKFIGGFLVYLFYFVFILPNKLISDKNKLHPKKILIIKLWAIGDSVISLPLIKVIRKRFPDCQIDLLGSNRTLAVFKGNSDLNNLLLINSPLKLILLLRKYDIAIDLEPYLNLSALLSFYSASQRYGFSAQHRSKLYTSVVDFRHDQHMLNNYLDFSKLINYSLTDEDKKLVKINYDFYSKSTVLNFLKSEEIKDKDLLIGICAGSGESAKTRLWDKNNFAELTDALIKKYDAKIIFVGGKNEEDLTEQIIELIQNKEKNRNKVINAVNKFSLKESCALIENCKIFISNDTGPMHIAAAHGVRTIGLFGPNTPVLWKPYGDDNFAIYKNLECSPCIKNDKGVFPDCLRKEDKYLCMRLISVNDVLALVQKIVNDYAKQQS